LRPNVVSFVDRFLRNKDSLVRIEELKIQGGSKFIGKTLEETKIREKTGIIIIAIGLAKDKFIYNPPKDFKLTENLILLFIGSNEQIEDLRSYIES